MQWSWRALQHHHLSDRPAPHMGSGDAVEVAWSAAPPSEREACDSHQKPRYCEASVLCSTTTLCSASVYAGLCAAPELPSGRLVSVGVASKRRAFRAVHSVFSGESHCGVDARADASHPGGFC